MRSREQVASWAHAVREAEDAGTLEYEPSEAEKRIWRAILYLIGVDSKDGPDSYLHVEEDFRDFFEDWLSCKNLT